MADENPSVPPKVNPLGPRPSTLKLKPIIRPAAGGFKSGLKLPTKPGMKMPAKPAPAADSVAMPEPAATPVEGTKSITSSLEQLKSVTQNLKSITAPIPQQAILHKTGIIADPNLTAAQVAAAKARTSRIALSDAMGVAPVKNEPAPMKTIRIKRPVDIPSAAEQSPVPAPEVPALDPEPEEAETVATADTSSTTVTQRKTLKISRPGGAMRPAGKFGIKKPSQATTVAKVAPHVGEAAAEGEVADIPDLTEDSAFVPANGSLAAAAGVAAGGVANDVPKGVAFLGVAVQLAACVAMGMLAYRLWFDTTISTF